MIKLTVFYDEPYWVGVFELCEDEELRTARVVFGPEPKDYELYEWIHKNFYSLKFSLPIDHTHKAIKRINPKRMQRKISKELSSRGVSTKAMEAMRLEREQNKLEKKAKRRANKEKLEHEKYLKKQIKKKEKKKGH